VVLEKNHFSMAYSYLENENLSGSLYSVLRDYGIEPKQASHDISMTYASDAQAKLLDIETGTPLMRLHEVVYDQKGRPLHNSLQLIRGDRFVFRI
jgi:GntR family transcriptional regulator